jgi:radical SAM protein with 4Fe4S-binding SPASM domain
MADKMADPPVFPRLIDIEISAICNLKCRMCPTGLGTLKRKRGIMSDETFVKVIQESRRYGSAIRFVRWGEPLTHPSFTDYCKAVKDAGLLLHFNTNGVLFDYDLMTEVLQMNVDSVKFSFQGATPNEYKRWRGFDGFDSLYTIIEVLYARRGVFPTPYIRVGTTVTDADTAENIERFKDKFGAVADKVTVKKTRAGTETTSYPNCPEVWDKMSINWDGSVSACCSDSDNKMIIGDIHTQSMSNIWNYNARLNEIRDLLANRKHDEIEVCSRCRLQH